MMLVLFILVNYILAGFVVGVYTCVKHMNRWNESDMYLITILSVMFWPCILPALIINYIYCFLQKKFYELTGGNTYPELIRLLKDKFGIRC